jgi:hypothetical protein
MAEKKSAPGGDQAQNQGESGANYSPNNNINDAIFLNLPDDDKARLLAQIAAGRGGDNGQSPDAAATAGAVAPIRPIPMKELMAKDFPDLYFLVDGLLAKGNLAMLGGRAKGGKSWLVCQLAQAVDMGRTVFWASKPSKGEYCTSPWKMASGAYSSARGSWVGNQSGRRFILR